jgi:hypothetical protein
MGAAPIPKQPPVYGYTIDWSHPLARGLQFYVLGGTMVDMVSGHVFEPGTNAHNSISYQANEGGFGYQFEDNYGAGQQWGSIKIGGVWPSGLKNTTWAWAGIYPSDTYVFHDLWNVLDSAGTPLVNALCVGTTILSNRELRTTYYTEAGSDTTWGRLTNFREANGDSIESERYTTWCGALDGRGWTYNGQILNSKDFQDSVAGTPGSNPPTNNEPYRFILGRDVNGTPASHTLNCFAGWNRRLTNAELFDWTADPYQMLVPVIELFDTPFLDDGTAISLLSHPHRHTSLGFI